jgi:N-dimethylarginine dimethylaminohydrolase
MEVKEHFGMSVQSEFQPLSRVLLKHPREAFISDAVVASQWQALGFTAPPDLAKASAEFDALVALLQSAGAEVAWLPRADDTSLDSIYVRDASIVCDRGVIICRMGKPARSTETSAQHAALAHLSLPVLGCIESPGTVEGGDVFWLDERTLAVGRGYRTNDDGIRQLRQLLGDSIELMVVPLPHWRGPSDVMHLMSLVSPVDRDLAVVYSPLLPVFFREVLIARGFTLVEVPDEEFDTMGTNVLAIAPRVCIALEGNPVTRRRLEAAGATVIGYRGDEISRKGAGGPTCLTRPLSRSRTPTPGGPGSLGTGSVRRSGPLDPT